MRLVDTRQHAQTGSPVRGAITPLSPLLQTRWFGYAFGLAAVALVTAVLAPLLTLARVENASALYVLAVLATAALFGRGPALAASVAGFLAFDYFYVEPVFELVLRRPEEWVTLVVFLATALVAGQLAAALRQRAEVARQREREALVLYEVARLVPGSTLELPPLLGLILEQLKTIVEYDAAEVVLRTERNETVIFEYRGELPREQIVGHSVKRGDALWELLEQVDRRREPVLVEDLGGRSLLAKDLLAAGMNVPTEGAHAELAVPLMVKGSVIGVQTLIHSTPGYYRARQAELAQIFAQQAAVAIENARLYDEARGKAALEERQKLARELHDSVSQAMYGIALNASAADELFETAPERARGLLRDVLRLAEAGLAELRALIFELRPESLEREGLVAALEKQAAAVQARHGLHVRLEVQGEPDLSQPAKEALYRVAQEALHNAAKHARARTLDVALELGDQEVCLTVADDGRGFDPCGEFPGHLGLQSMRERAAALGGTLDIQSKPGRGTTLSAHIPLPAHPSR
jgi:signal transduction histidine kinase